MQSTDSDEMYEYFRKYGQQMGFGIFRRDTRKHTYHTGSLAPEVENQEGRRTQSLKGLILLQKLSLQLK